MRMLSIIPVEKKKTRSNPFAKEGLDQGRDYAHGLVWTSDFVVVSFLLDS